MKGYSIFNLHIIEGFKRPSIDHKRDGKQNICRLFKLTSVHHFQVKNQLMDKNKRNLTNKESN